MKFTSVKSKTEDSVWECAYVPSVKGQYIINITFGEQHITKSPFKVEVRPTKVSKIRAYGPGLEGGVVNQPAVFTVETNGETGALGMYSKLLFLSHYKKSSGINILPYSLYLPSNKLFLCFIISAA